MKDHPLDGKNPETHADHLNAYADYLKNADPGEIDGVMLVVTSGAGTDTLPSVSDDVDPRMVSLWMLASHIHHIASSAQKAGANADMEQVAHDAIGLLREHGFSDP